MVSKHCIVVRPIIRFSNEAKVKELMKYEASLFPYYLPSFSFLCLLACLLSSKHKGGENST